MIERWMDASANRAAEGLRVLEDIARFSFNQPVTAAQAKAARHLLRTLHESTWIAARDTSNDLGRTPTGTNPSPRQAAWNDLIRANANRASEALRALAEAFGQQGRGEAAGQCEQARFAVYDVEKVLLAALPAQRLWTEKLYVLIDTQTCADPVAATQATAANGAGIVQLRGKDLNTEAYWRLAQELQQIVRQAGGLFIVNDHIDIAAAIRADGVHVGQGDAPVALARAALGDQALIGVSCHSLDDLQAAQATTADYVGMGPMFATSTKAHEPARGPELLDALRDELRLPSYAIGGLSLERTCDLLPHIPHGIAVASAIGSASDVAAATRAFANIINKNTQ